MTGLAYPRSDTEARCAKFKEMKFDDKVVPEPFACNPTNPEKRCELYYEVDAEDEADSTAKEYINGPAGLGHRAKILNYCKCALDG